MVCLCMLKSGDVIVMQLIRMRYCAVCAHAARFVFYVSTSPVMSYLQVGYLERVNAELCELLEKCDAEALSQQGGLQSEKRELLQRTRQLQEEVRGLHRGQFNCI